MMIKEIEKINYRKAGVQDAEVLTEYRVRFLKEMMKDFDAEKEGELRSELLKYFEKAIAAKNYISYFAEIKGQIVGLGGMAIYDRPGNFYLPNGKFGYILNMFTIEGHRKKGICNEIMNRLINDGREAGLRKFELHATPDGEPIYVNMGFKEPFIKAMEMVVE